MDNIYLDYTAQDIAEDDNASILERVPMARESCSSGTHFDIGFLFRVLSLLCIIIVKETLLSQILFAPFAVLQVLCY